MSIGAKPFGVSAFGAPSGDGSATKTLTSQLISATVNAPSIDLVGRIVVTGVATASSLGTVTLVGGSATALSSVTASVPTPSISIDVDANLTLASVTASAALNSTTAQAKGNSTATAVTASAALGSITFIAPANVTLSSPALTTVVSDSVGFGIFANVDLPSVTAATTNNTVTTNLTANPTSPSVSATTAAGTLTGDAEANETLSGVSLDITAILEAGDGSGTQIGDALKIVPSASLSTSDTFTHNVTVASGTNSYGTGNKYYVSGYSGASPTIALTKGSTYIFDQSDSSNSGHPFKFSTTANGTHGGGAEYTVGVTSVGIPGYAGAYTQIVVQDGAPSTLYYYCQVHSGMGGSANVSPRATIGFEADALHTITGQASAGISNSTVDFDAEANITTPSVNATLFLVPDLTLFLEVDAFIDIPSVIGRFTTNLNRPADNFFDYDSIADLYTRQRTVYINDPTALQSRTVHIQPENYTLTIAATIESSKTVAITR